MKHNVRILPEKRKSKDGSLILKNVPLFADIRFAGIRLFYYSGYRIDIINFDESKEEMRRNTKGLEGSREVQYNEINQRLKAIKAALILHFQSIDSTSKEQIKQLLDSVCKKSNLNDEQPEKAFFDLFYKYHRVYRISEGRKKHVLSAIKHWERYQDERKIKLSFNSIGVDTLRDFEYYLTNESVKKVTKKDKYLPKTIGVNTLHTYMKITKDFWVNFAIPELAEIGIELHNPFDKKGYKIPSEVYGTPIYITSKERDLLINTSLPSEKLSKVRDAFVFQCLVGVRLGDLKKLTLNHIHENTLSYIPRKTKDGKPVTVTVPLHPIAIKIIEKYHHPDLQLLPLPSDQKYNDYIKELFEFCGITRIVNRRNPKTGNPEQVRICDIASSHMARRAFIGNLYGKVDSGIISSMSGHSPGSRAFSRYYDVSKELQQEAIKML